MLHLSALTYLSCNEYAWTISRLKAGNFLGLASIFRLLGNHQVDPGSFFAEMAESSDFLPSLGFRYEVWKAKNCESQNFVEVSS